MKCESLILRLVAPERREDLLMLELVFQIFHFQDFSGGKEFSPESNRTNSQSYLSRGKAKKAEILEKIEQRN